MKYNLKRFLALVMALMLAVPTFAFTEDAEAVVIEDAMDVEDYPGEIDEAAGAIGDLDLGLDLSLDFGEPASEGGDMLFQTEDASEAAHTPAFEQTQRLKACGLQSGPRQALWARARGFA